MSGTGRPTYRTRKGSANPAASYMTSKSTMVRDLPGHMKMKLREKKTFDREELKKKLEQIGKPAIDFTDAKEFDDIDADYSEHEPVDEASSDDQEALLRELARLKKQKAEEEARKMKEKFAANPLVNPDYSLKLKWTEERVFRNQAATEPPKRDDFVNDPVRNEAHKKFLQKYLHT